MTTKLEEMRLEKGYSKSDIAIKANISVMSYYRYESGKRKPHIDVAQRLALALGTTVGELFPVGEVSDSA